MVLPARIRPFTLEPAPILIVPTLRIFPMIKELAPIVSAPVDVPTTQ